MYRYALLAMAILVFNGCDHDEPSEHVELSLGFNEIVSSNDGVNIDETGQTEDWIELINHSDKVINLQDFSISDSNSGFIPLPEHPLSPGETVLLWADDDTDEGALHLPFKISASGESLALKRNTDGVQVTLNLPPLDTNISFARFPDGNGDYVACRYPTPGRNNGTNCSSQAAPVVTDSVTFTPFRDLDWPRITPQTLAINELAFTPEGFIEFKNFSDEQINLMDYQLVIAPYPPSAGLPAFDDPDSVTLFDYPLAPGKAQSVALSPNQINRILQQDHQEGIAVLYDKTTQLPVDQLPFMHWPTQASLARNPSTPHRFQFCYNATPNTEAPCDPVEKREIGNRTRGIYTPGDFAALASGTAKSNVQSVKFIIDLQNDGALHFPAASEWPLHYTFVREVIDQDPRLDRCDASEANLFNIGWSRFSQENYSNTTTRRYHLGTLSKHANAGVFNVEFTFGDRILAEQMRDAFYRVTPATLNPYAWTLRPQDATQVAKVREIEGSVPLVGPNAPFADIVFQGLTPGVAFGTLTFIDTAELESASLGQRIIVITNDVPNDIDFVGGLITETFQTPLAHVNLLSQARNTPNMALPNARSDANLTPFLNKLVRLEVNDGGYQIREATLQEAQAFWEQQLTQGDPLVPRLNATQTDLVDLLQADVLDIPSIGAKAAQLAEVMNLDQSLTQCNEGAQFSIPEGAFAIPIQHYLQHMQASGAQEFLDSLLADEHFFSDIQFRKLSLQSVRQLVMQHPVEPALLAQVESWVSERFGNKRVRFRSSSNTEDLEEFNGAGLYTSISAELDDPDRRVDDAMRTVWSSLWNARAFEERYFSNVDQSQVGMAVLVHRAFTNERANGVAVARNILSPLRPDQYYINSQAGEASVTNPAPGVVTEQLIYQWPPRTPTLTYHSYSNLLDNQPVISAAETRALACAMSAIQYHFKNLLDPFDQNRWFTMESEFKLLGEERELLIKQARPYKLPVLDIPNDCRENI